MKQVSIVPHTHWDREWDESFPSLLVRLVALCDRLLDQLDADPSMRFLLDGQTVLVDDYLEVRPEAAPRLKRLVERGQLHLGPWAVLMDEFLVSGETIVRNLQLGLTRAAELGGAMPVGYLPDMFGHIAQMPQLLVLAGIHHAVVWRGVPSALDRTAFRWEAPDGSSVRAEYLYGSYANGRDLGPDASALVDRARSYETELGGTRLPGGDLLLMNGGDRSQPEPGLTAMVAEANDRSSDHTFTVTSLPEHLDAQPTTGLPSWSGELRSGACSPLLMGIVSNRVDVHRARAAAELALERTAEPLHAIFRTADGYPAPLIDRAWRQLILNSAHDSAGACSIDEVVDAVLVRHRGARQIATALGDQIIHEIAGRIDTGIEAGTGSDVDSVVVVNPGRGARNGLVAVDVPETPDSGDPGFVADDGTPCLTQRLTPGGALHPEGLDTVVTGRKIHWVLDRIRGSELGVSPIAEVTTEQHGPDDWSCTFRAAAPGEPPVDLAATGRELLALAERGATIRIRHLLAPTRTVLVQVPAVPGFGWRTLRRVQHEDAVDGATHGGARATNRTLENDLIRVTVDAATGTFTIRTGDGLEVSGLDRLVDGGDGGDTYNYSPPTSDRLIDVPTSVRVSVLDVGPVRARLLVERRYELPTHAIGDERCCTSRADTRVPVEIRTELELRAGERFVRIRTELDHDERDHRLRSHFPLPTPVNGSDAECAYAVVHRGLAAEGGPQEHGLPTFPSRRFVDCSDGRVGLAILHRGVHEYEVTAGGRELALTILRATGYLSRARPALRPVPAGPLTAVTGAQLSGRQVAEYAVLLHPGDWRAAGVHQQADAYDLELLSASVPPTPPLLPFPSGSDHRLPPAGQGLRIDGAEVAALRRQDGRLVVRLYNPRAATETAVITTDGRPRTGRVVDLVGQVLEPFTGSMTIGPARIVTLELDELAP